MARPKDVLSPADYTNYRNVRAVLVLFTLFGSMLVLGGIGVASGKNPNQQEQIHSAMAVGMAIAGMAGAIGGVAALRGSRRWAPLVYVMAGVYVFGFPIGTILSFVIFTGLSRYLTSMERIQAVSAQDAEPGTAAAGV